MKYYLRERHDPDASREVSARTICAHLNKIPRGFTITVGILGDYGLRFGSFLHTEDVTPRGMVEWLGGPAWWGKRWTVDDVDSVAVEIWERLTPMVHDT